MATATAPALEQLRKEITAIESDIPSLRSKLSVAESKLTANQAEQVEVSEGIARGTRKGGDSVAILRRSEEIMASVAGLRGLIAKNQAQLDEFYPEMRRQEAEALLVARRAEVETLKQHGAEIVARMNEKLRTLITADLPGLDAVRDEMMKYKDLGGQAAGAALCESLLTHNGTLIEEDRLTNMRRDLHTSPPAWTMRGDVVLTVRNLWPPKR